MKKYILTIEAEISEDGIIGFKEQLAEKIGNIKVLKVTKKEKEVCEMDEMYAGELAYKNGYEQGVKDFAERLTDRICKNVNRSLDNPDGYNYFPIDVYEDIDNLAKELMEGKKNEMQRKADS